MTPTSVVRSLDDRLHGMVTTTLGPGDPDPWVTRGIRLWFVRVVAGLTVALVGFAMVAGAVALVSVGIRLTTG